MPILYPVGLTRSTQWILGLLVIALNLAIYLWVLRRQRIGSGTGKGQLR